MWVRAVEVMDASLLAGAHADIGEGP